LTPETRGPTVAVANGKLFGFPFPGVAVTDALRKLLLLILLLAAERSYALEPVLLRESTNPGGIGPPCALAASTNGTCGNYRWYNLCSGYIWVFSGWAAGEAVGVEFGLEENPCVTAPNAIRRVITYYRNVVPNYNQTVNVHLDMDVQGDGCREATLASDIALDPALRWNCSELGVCVPADAAVLMVRQVHGGAAAPTFATDYGGPASECNPPGVARSAYYGVNSESCLQWIGPTGRSDNFLTWLVIDTADCSYAEANSWGQVKGLFR
jgi:hypothetical protein